MNIRKTLRSDRIDVAKIYRTAWEGTEGIARRPHEITETYIFSLLNKSDDEIVSLVAEDENGELMGVVHATKDGLEGHDHIISDLTIIVPPVHQRKGVAKALGVEFLKYISKERKDVMRVEMAAPQSLSRIEAFKAFGFNEEGIIKNRFRTQDGSFIDISLMAWINPNFDPNFKY